MSGKDTDDVANCAAGDQIGEAVAAEEERRIGLERRAEDVDELRVIRIVVFRSDVAIDLVATWMLHCVALGQLTRVLALADGRMIARQLFESPAAQLVQ